jgi:hypothetical protein
VLNFEIDFTHFFSDNVSLLSRLMRQLYCLSNQEAPRQDSKILIQRSTSQTPRHTHIFNDYSPKLVQNLRPPRCLKKGWMTSRARILERSKATAPGNQDIRDGASHQEVTLVLAPTQQSALPLLLATLIKQCRSQKKSLLLRASLFYQSYY